jgi:spermidine/putrescine transport system substrate-binding protein
MKDVLRTNVSRRNMLKGTGIAAVGITLAACGKASTGAAASAKVTGPIESTLMVANWPNYTDPEAYKQFQAEFGPKVTVDTFGSNEELIAKLSAGGSNYDIIVPSGSAVAPVIARKLARPLDPSLIPNLKNIDPAFRGLAYDPKNDYSAIKDYGVTGFLYKKSSVPNPPTTLQGWFELVPTMQGKKINFLDGPTEAPLVALAALGIDINTTDADQYAKGMKLLEDSKSAVTSLNSTYIDAASQGQYDITMAWNGDMPGIIETAKKQGIELDYFIDQQRGVFWTDTWAIAAGSPHPVAAHAWINWMLDPKTAQSQQDFVGYTVPIEGVKPSGNPETDLSSEVLGRLQTITRSPDLDALRSRYWDEYKA